MTAQGRRPGQAPRTSSGTAQASDDLSGPDRLAIMLAKPELQAQALQRLIAEWLRRAYPDRLDDTLSHAMAGAVVGALVGAVLGGTERGDSPHGLREQIRRALTLLEDGLGSLE
jgi:MftR C-terminal domain